MLFLSFLTVFSQKVEIKGKLIDGHGDPLLYASIALNGSLDGTTTDEKGEFSFFTIERGRQTLVGSYIGYKTSLQEIIIGEEAIHVEMVLLIESTKLQEVVITAGSFEASDVKSNAVMRSKDIGTTAGATGDLTKAIETLPGVQTVGESNGLFVRGGAGSECQILFDEMVIQNPFYSPVPDTKQRGRFDPFMFSGTTFSTGGYSALYGQALSSTLALTSNGLADSTNTGGGIHTYGTNLFHVHRWENTSIYAKGEYNNLAPYHKTFKQLTEWEKSPENIGATFSFRQRFSENDILKLYTNYSRTKLAMQYDNNDSTNHKSLFKLQNDNLYVNTSYKKYFKDEEWSLFIGSSYSKDVDDARIDGINMSEDEELIQGKVIVKNRSLPGTTIHAGSEIQVRNVSGRESIPNDDDNILSGEINDVYWASFMEANWAITPRLGTRIGIRHEFSEFLSESNLAPRLSFAYKTGESSQVSFAYGKFYQTPLNEFLYYDRDLDFESAFHYIANFQFMKNKKIFRIELYDKEYKNLVKYTHEQDKNYNNRGTGYARGIDIFWRDRKTIPNTDYWISYSYLDTKREYHNFPISATPSFASKHNLSVVYKYWLRKFDSMLGLTYAYSSGRPYFNPERPENEFHKDLTHAYNNLSINVSIMTRLLGRGAVIYVSLENILGSEHIFGYHYLPNDAGRIPIRPSSVRSFFVGLFISTY